MRGGRLSVYRKDVSVGGCWGPARKHGLGNVGQKRTQPRVWGWRGHGVWEMCGVFLVGLAGSWEEDHSSRLPSWGLRAVPSLSLLFPFFVVGFLPWSCCGWGSAMRGHELPVGLEAVFREPDLTHHYGGRQTRGLLQGPLLQWLC